MDERGMYGERAVLYEKLYASKDYASEAVQIRDRLQALGVPDGARVLELACGTGSHLAHLRQHFDVQGLDLNEGMLAIARGKLPGVPLVQGDMTAFTLDRPVHAVLCLFSSIGYVDPARLKDALRCIHDALEPGGIALVEPWLTPERIRHGRPWLDTVEEPDLKIARACTTVQDGRVTRLDFQWLIATPAGVEHVVDAHVLWSSTREELLAAFAAVGLDPTWDDAGLNTGRGLVIGRRRPAGATEE